MSDVQLNKLSVAAACSIGVTAAAVGYMLYSRRRIQLSKSPSNTTKTDTQHYPAYSTWSKLIGDTPLVRINCLSKATGCEIWAKAEYTNPGGSTKDRVAKQLIEDALNNGSLKIGGSVYEGTSGSTGISLALLSREKGISCHIFMPDDQAVEKSDTLKTLGANVTRVKPVSIVHPQHFVNLARSEANKHEGSIFADQFENLSNYRAHYLHTGPEIWKQTDGKLSAFVMGAGTGGTIAGVSTYLKENNKAIEIYLADPQGSSLYNRVMYGVAFAPEQAERKLRRHRYDTIVEGVGLDRVTKNFENAKIDGAFRVTDEEAIAMSRYLLWEEGLFVGSSSAMNLAAVIKLIRRQKWQNSGRQVVTLLCDHGSRHMSRFWNDEFLVNNRNVNIKQLYQQVQSSQRNNLPSEQTRSTEEITETPSKLNQDENTKVTTQINQISSDPLAFVQ